MINLSLIKIDQGSTACLDTESHVLTTVSKLQGKHTALMQMKLVFVRLGDMKNFNVAALHSYSEPLSCRTVAEREDLDERDRKYH